MLAELLYAGAVLPAAAAEPAAPAAPEAPVPAPSLSSAADLLRMFSASDGLEIRFEERKQTRFFAAPLISRGKLYFDRSLGLARWVETPHPSVAMIDDRTLQFEGPNGWQTLDVASDSVLTAMIGGFFDLLKGDSQRLESAYEVAFESDAREATAWKLVLTPKDPRVRALVSMISIEGAARRPRRLIVVEHGGDETVTIFEALDPDRRFSDDEKTRLFRAKPSS